MCVCVCSTFNHCTEVASIMLALLFFPSLHCLAMCRFTSLRAIPCECGGGGLPVRFHFATFRCVARTLCTMCCIRWRDCVHVNMKHWINTDCIDHLARGKIDQLFLPESKRWTVRNSIYYILSVPSQWLLHKTQSPMYDARKMLLCLLWPAAGDAHHTQHTQTHFPVFCPEKRIEHKMQKNKANEAKRLTRDNGWGCADDEVTHGVWSMVGTIRAPVWRMRFVPSNLQHFILKAIATAAAAARTLACMCTASECIMCLLFHTHILT